MDWLKVGVIVGANFILATGKTLKEAMMEAKKKEEGRK